MSEQVGSVTRKKSSEFHGGREFNFNRVLQSDGHLKIKTFSKQTLSV